MLYMYNNILKKTNKTTKSLVYTKKEFKQENSHHNHKRAFLNSNI